MKKQLILILSLFLLVGVTAGILLLVNNMEKENAAEAQRLTEEKQLVNVYSNDIERIELKSEDTFYNASLDENGQWQLENEVDFEINTYFLNSMASQLSTLTATDVIAPIAEADLTQYGLDQPRTIVLHANGEARTLNVGKLSATKEFYYVTVDNKDKVFSVSADYADYLCAGKNSLKSIYVLRNSDSAVTEISLDAHGENIYSLMMDEEKQWHMLAPIEIDENINVSGVNSVLTTISQMIVDRFGEEHVTKEQYAELGFDDPEYIFSFAQENGSETTLLFQDYDVNATDFVSALCVETGQVFYMESTYTDFLQGQADIFFIEEIYTGTLSNVKKVDIDWTEREDTLITADDENNKYTLNGAKVEEIGTAAVNALDDFFNKLRALRYDALVLENPIATDAEPEISITFTENDDTTFTMEFYSADEENFAVFANGEYSYFTISKKNFTARDGIYDYFDRLLDVMDD